MAGHTSIKVSFPEPLHEVFIAFTNLRENGERYSGILSLSVLTDGPIGPGTRFRETRKVMGTTSEIEFIVEDLQPGKRYEIVSVDSPLTYRTANTFAEQSDGTSVVSEFTVAAGQGWDVFVTPVLQSLAWLMRGTLRQDFADLRRIVADAN